MRHGETDWSRVGKHTGRTDVPLDERGRDEARAIAPLLSGRPFALVLTSPRSRAVETCRLAGLGAQAQVRDDLSEWDYGEYEGRTTAEIRSERPGWSLWREGPPGGETVAAVGARADRLIGELVAAEGTRPCSRTGTCCGCLPLAGWVSRRATAAGSPSIRPR